MNAPAGMRTGRLRVAWLAPYPTGLLLPQLRVARPPRREHACSWIVNLSAALAKRDDIELHLVTENGRVLGDQAVQHEGLTIHVAKVGLPFVHRGFPGWLPLDLLTALRWNTSRLGRLVRTIQPDLVHAHGTEAAFAAAGLASGHPCLISIQGIVTEYHKTNPSFRSRLIQRWEQDQVRRARYFTCRTTFDTSFVRSLNPSARIFTIQEAMHEVFFRPPWTRPDEPTLLFVGSPAPRKGLETLLTGFAQLVASRPQVRLRVIGGGDFSAVHERCRMLGIEKSLEFLGFQSANQIAAWHRKSQVFVLPSDNENSPNTLAEAMVSGMPVIATAVGGIPSMVQDGVSGLLVPPRDPVRLAQAILRLLANPVEQARLGANARQVTQKRHWPQSVAEETLQAYRMILEETGKA